MVQAKETSRNFNAMRKTKTIGIPAMWDRIVQQCILQVLESQSVRQNFMKGVNGFRPNRSAEHAIADTKRMMQRQNLHFVIYVYVKGFFYNVNHQKLIK